MQLNWTLFRCTKSIQKKSYYPRAVYTDIYISLVNNTETKKYRQQHRDQKIQAADFISSKNTYWLDRILQESGIRILYYFQDGLDKAFVHEELMHVCEDTHVHPDLVSEWK